MASILTTLGKATKQKGVFGSSFNTPVYLQFVPGYVVEVVHSKESLRFSGEQSINTIIALPHVTDKAYKARNATGEQNRYYPLLRGIQDIPSKGDPVLLCTMNKTNYYLGPINTINNSPTWNTDPGYRPEAIIPSTDKGKVGKRGENGQSINFNKEISYKRLVKKHKDNLDFGEAKYETTGDMLFEGRHGNSLRIGSRDDDPYVFISNGRNSTNNVESLTDGTLISITSKGTLEQHFGTYIETETGTEQERLTSYEEGTQKFGFQLASDTISSPNRLMSSLISSLNNDIDSQQLIYDYGNNNNNSQVLLHSDRIILNSKSNDIYLSSFGDINIGSGKNINISVNDSLVIESQNIYLGDPNKKTMDNLVLGEKLKVVLNEIVELIPKITIFTQAGNQRPLPDINSDIKKVVRNIKNITSNKHFIEQN
mgnify:CR=1 FL=1